MFMAVGSTVFAPLLFKRGDCTRCACDTSTMALLAGLASFEQLFCRLSVAHLVRVFNRFPPDVIFCLAMTSHTLSCAVDCYARQAWHIDVLLSTWFLNPQKFRQTLSSCRAIVGGMPALQFFDRSAQRAKSFDIFVRFDGLY